MYMLQSTDQFFLFALLWTTQHTAHSTAPSAYKYSTCTCTRTSCPAYIIFTACPTCLQPVPHQPPPPIRCHRLLRAPPRLCPATATPGKPASPASATFPCVMILGLVGPLFLFPSRPLSLLTHLGPLPPKFPPTFTYLQH